MCERDRRGLRPLTGAIDISASREVSSRRCHGPDALQIYSCAQACENNYIHVHYSCKKTSDSNISGPVSASAYLQLEGAVQIS